MPNYQLVNMITMHSFQIYDLSLALTEESEMMLEQLLQSLVINQLMLRQIDQQEPYSPDQPRHFSHSPHKYKNQMSQYISNLSKTQQKTLINISEKCSNLQYVIASVEVLVGKVGQRVQGLTQKNETQLLGSLKMKQYEFMVSELKGSLAKQIKKEERLTEELDCERKKVQKYREEVFKFEAKNTSLTQKVKRLDHIIKEKSVQIQDLNQMIMKLKLQTSGDLKLRHKTSSHSQPSSPLQHHHTPYQELENNLQELQKQFESKVATLQYKNKELHQALKRSQDQCDEEKALSKMYKKQMDQMNILKYQIEIKLKKETQLNAQLQESYNKLLENSKSVEITLHKQIQQFKSKQNTLRNDYKKEKKHFKGCLSSIAQTINNNSKYYLYSSSVSQQVQEIKKLFEKTMKKKTEQLGRQLQHLQSQNQKLKIRNQQVSTSLLELEKKEKRGSGILGRNLSERDSARYENSDKKSEANSSFINRSTDKSEEQKYKSVKQKYEGKLEVLRKDLKGKQGRINQLQRQQQTQFDKSKEKILQLELAVSEKQNEIRKFELKLKEKDYEVKQSKSAVKQLQSKLSNLSEKLENQKESGQKLLEVKIHNYQEKLKNLKNNYKQLEKKEQQKTIKYNKLKNKYQKYQIEASESLKRKNTQLDQLLKQNNKLKTQVKLLEQKININNIIQKEVNTNVTPQINVVNQDLIQQIQMERDRISLDLSQKQKQCCQVIEVNTKMSSEILTLKRQLRDVKSKFEDLTRQYRNLDEENKYAKEKLEDLAQKEQQQLKENHAYFKKELEKNIASVKKLEKSCEKYKADKQRYKKQIEQLQAEILSLKNANEKLKEKNSRLANENLDEMEQRKRIISDYEIKLSECKSKEEQLVDIINYKNREGDGLRESMRGEQLIEEAKAQEHIKHHQQTSTEGLIEYADTAANTDLIQEIKVQAEKNQGLQDKPIIPSEMLLGGQYEYDEEGSLLDNEQVNQQEPPLITKKESVVKEINYFNDQALENGQLQQNFDICQEGQEINIAQSSLNLQIKDVFNCLRKEIEKIFNEEQMSIDVIKVLPKQLQDDFTEFMGYIKEKILQIKNQNNLSFIMAEVGNEPEEIDEQIGQFLARQSQQYMRLRKIIEEKQYMITGLMSQKTEQENTINQLTMEKEQMDEENQNRFMNQCTVYKKQIKEYKKLIDILEMNCQSLKNIFKNTIELLTEEDDNQDDIKDNLVLFSNICKLNEADKKKIATFLEQYRLSRLKN